MHNRLLPFDTEFASPSQHAEYYRSLGWQIVPALSPKDVKFPQSWKRPALPSWREFEDALVDDHKFLQWFGPTGQYTTRPNLGVICGPASNNLWILDLDTQKNPMAQLWLDSLVERNGGPFRTPTQRTGGGGLQIVFRAPKGWRAPTGKTALGVDSRGFGGFAMLSPSRHESGRLYEWLPDFAPWEVEVIESPDFVNEAVEHVLKQGSAGPSQKTDSPDVSTDAWGAIVDGREGYMTRLVFASVLNLYREAPFPPTGEKLVEIAKNVFSQYEQRVKSRLVEPNTANHILLEREGRGITMFQQKWAAAMAQWDTKIAEWAARPVPERKTGSETPSQGFIKGGNLTVDPDTGEIVEENEFAVVESLFDLLDVPAIKAMQDPRWLVEGMIIERSLTFLYSPPGAGKSFLALCIAYHIACDFPQWFEKPIQQNGPVIYISSEGTADMKFRLMALEQEYGVVADEKPFYLIPNSMDFMKEDDIAKLTRTVQQVIERTGKKPVMLFIDTCSRVLPGMDENLQRDATLFIKACDALREAFECCVVGVHHSGKSGDIRGSTVLTGAGDALLSLTREEGEEVAMLTAKKIKAAADGWKLFVRLKKRPVGDVRGTESLVAVLETEAPVAADGWPDRSVCNAALVAMEAAWDRGNPWSPYPQTRREGRYAPVCIEAFGVAADVAEQMVEAWAVQKVIAVETVSSKSKIKGFRVLKSGRNLGGSRAEVDGGWEENLNKINEA